MKLNHLANVRPQRYLSKKNRGYKFRPTHTLARAHGRSQAIDTLIAEEALLLAKYVRNERKTWVPRVAI